MTAINSVSHKGEVEGVTVDSYCPFPELGADELPISDLPVSNLPIIYGMLEGSGREE